MFLLNKSVVLMNKTSKTKVESCHCCLEYKTIQTTGDNIVLAKGNESA